MAPPLAQLCFALFYVHSAVTNEKNAATTNHKEVTKLPVVRTTSRTVSFVPRDHKLAAGTQLLATPQSDQADAILSTVREGIIEMTGSDELWDECIIVLSEFAEIEPSEAEHLLIDGWGWKGWASASKLFRKYQKPQLPDPDALKNALSWLTEGPLQMDTERLCVAIRDSPKVYLKGPEETYQQALAAAPEEYKDPENFRKLWLKDPFVLQCTYNCVEDGCASECGNCWVSYSNRV